MSRHFSDDFGMQPFEGMQPELLVCALSFTDSWCSRNNGETYESESARRSVFFQLIKSDPMICSNESKKSKSAWDVNAHKQK